MELLLRIGEVCLQYKLKAKVRRRGMKVGEGGNRVGSQSKKRGNHEHGRGIDFDHERGLLL